MHCAPIFYLIFVMNRRSFIQVNIHFLSLVQRCIQYLNTVARRTLFPLDILQREELPIKLLFAGKWFALITK